MKSATFSLFLCIYCSIAWAQDFVKSSIRPYDSQAGFLESEFQDWIKVDSVFLYGGGSLFGLLTPNEEVDGQPNPSGSLGLNFVTKRLSCNLFYSYNGVQTLPMKTLGQFGSTLMNINRGGQSLSFSVFAQLHNHFGISGRFVIVDNLWELKDSVSLDASPINTQIGVFVRPFIFALTDNKIDFTLNAHFSHRRVLGDFANQTRFIGEQSIEPTGYNGVDLSANIFLNEVHMFVQYSQNSEADFEIPGFSGSQVSFGVNVAGRLMKLK